MNERNIKEIDADIKKSILEVEKNGASESLLESIDSDFRDFFELIKLFLISERDSYYGYFLMNLLIETDFYRSFIAAVKLNADPPVFTCNPLILCKMEIKEIIYVICHEIEHLLLNHPALVLSTVEELTQESLLDFNYAADASVNDRLDAEVLSRKASFMKAPEGVINSKALKEILGLDAIKRLENYAYYYGLIAKDKKKKPRPSSGPENVVDRLSSGDKDSSNQGEGSSSQDEDQSKEDSVNKENSNGNGGSPNESGKEAVTIYNHGEMEDHNWGVDDPEEAQEATKAIVNAAFESMDKETRGLMPGHFLSEVERINKPPVIKWERLLKKYVGTVPSGKRKTRTRLNRRQPNRYDLSGEMRDRMIKIVVAIDTSGSVSDSMIANILSEIESILSKRKREITVIECDSEIQRVYRVENAGQVDHKVAGRGGTYFTPVIELVNKERYYRDALLVYFTDGYGESFIPKPLVYRLLWVVFGNKKNLSLKEPYGDVVPFKENEDE